MTPRKHRLLVCRAPYGGNGGLSSEHPSICNWLLRNTKKIAADERIEEIRFFEAADTPITMVRNAFVEKARQVGCDLLLMIDSDQYPDYELDHNHDPFAKPFWDTSFDFLYEHWTKGPCVIGAPYCGPSPHQNVYVFHWTNLRNETANSGPRLDQYRREHAAIMSGIQPCAALPTGLILFDIRCFDLVKPPYFYYQYEGDGARCELCHEIKPGVQAKKSSTEDVTATRDISLAGQATLGYNPVYCNWDAWAGHVKQEIVAKPRPIFVDNVTAKFSKSFEHGIRSSDRLVDVDGSEFANRPCNGTVAEPCDDVWADEDHNSTTFDRVRQTELVRRAARPDGSALIAEIGSYKGHTAKHFLKAIPRAHVACVDTWFGVNSDPAGINMMRDGLFEHFKRNCQKEIDAKQIEVLRGMSVAVANAVATGPGAGKFDLVYIDADHSYESAKADIEAWLPLVRDGGIICGHDFDAVDRSGAILFPGVRRAVEEAFGDDFERPTPGSSVWAHVVKRRSPKSVLATGRRVEFTKHTRPEQRIVDRIVEYTRDMKSVLEIGPGHSPLATATHFVDRDDLDLPNFTRMDFDGQRLPFGDKEFDFVYCRHTLEDIQNPQMLCDEMSRVAKEGFIQVPSTVAECCLGIDGGRNESPSWRGFIHHRHFVYVADGVLTFLPKMPAVEKMDWRDSDDAAIRKLLNERQANWNESLYWRDQIHHRTLSHGRDFSLNKDYEGMVLALATRVPHESLPDVATHKQNGHAKPKRKRKAALTR